MVLCTAILVHLRDGTDSPVVGPSLLRSRPREREQCTIWFHWEVVDQLFGPLSILQVRIIVLVLPIDPTLASPHGFMTKSLFELGKGSFRVHVLYQSHYSVVYWQCMIRLLATSRTLRGCCQCMLSDWLPCRRYPRGEAGVSRVCGGRRPDATRQIGSGDASGALLYPNMPKLRVSVSSYKEWHFMPPPGVPRGATPAPWLLPIRLIPHGF